MERAGRFEPHDLLRLDSSGVAAIVRDRAAPEWVSESLERAPWVVVRRARAVGDGCVPVGARGEVRARRFACEIAVETVLERLTPADLAPRAQRLLPGCAARAALIATGPIVDSHLGEVNWGPVGSIGFQLATGVRTVHVDSDLDLIVEVKEPVERAQARLLLDAFVRLPCRIDCQLIVGAGSVALAEWAGESDQVLLRTVDGPVLTGDPWAVPSGQRDTLVCDRGQA